MAFDSTRDYWAIELADVMELWTPVGGPILDGPETVKHFQLYVYTSEQLASDAVLQKVHVPAKPKRITGERVLKELGSHGSLYVDDQRIASIGRK